MKTLAGALATHYAGTELTTAFAIHITRPATGSPAVDVLGFTSHDVAQTVDGVLCAAGGLAVTNVTSTADLAVDNLELTTLDDGSLFLVEQVVGGLWRDSTYKLMRYNWASPTDGVEYISAGVLGNIRFLNGQVVVELRGYKQYLNQPVGTVSTRTCRARLGDALCRVNLGPFTFNATVTTATSQQQFTATALTQATNYFTEGVLTWHSGLNNRMSQKVKVHTNPGIVLLMLPMPYTVTVGDTFTIVAGCRKRLTEDCIAKFNNVLNFQGEPHRLGLDAMTSPPVPGE